MEDSRRTGDPEDRKRNGRLVAGARLMTQRSRHGRVTYDKRAPIKNLYNVTGVAVGRRPVADLKPSGLQAHTWTTHLRIQLAQLQINTIRKQIITNSPKGIME